MGNLIYVFVNLDTFAAEQLKESIVVENYKFLIEGLIGAPGQGTQIIIISAGEKDEGDVRRKRAFGSVMGAFVGDAAGAVLEFYNQRITEQDVEWALKMNGGGENEMGPG